MPVSLPADTANAAYAPAILAAVEQGNFSTTWGIISSDYNGHHAEFRVMTDAMKMDVAGPDGVEHKNVRISVSAHLEQQIADLLNCSLLTPKLADLLWEQRNVTLVPTPQTITSMTAAMIENSAAIDAQFAAQGNPTGIIQTVGKHWVIDASESFHTGKAENYGWHFAKSFGGSPWAACASDPSNRNCRVIQDPGWFHPKTHLDYSQSCVLVSRLCLLDGNQVDIQTILTSKDLAPLASHNGVITYLRQPGVPVLQPLGVKLPAVGPNSPSLVSWTEGGAPEMHTDWKSVAWSAGALALVVGGFFGGLYLMGKHAPKKNPILSQYIEWKIVGKSYEGYGKVTGTKYAIVPAVMRTARGKPIVSWMLYENSEITTSNHSTDDLMLFADDIERDAAPKSMASESIASEPLSPYTFDYRGVKTVITKKRNGWCYGKGKAQKCVPSFRDAIIAVKSAIDASQT